MRASLLANISWLSLHSCLNDTELSAGFVKDGGLAFNRSRAM